MSVENPLWGAPRIHGELLKLGFEIAQWSGAKYKSNDGSHPARDGAPFCFVVPTIGSGLLVWLVIVRLHRRDPVWINVTANPPDHRDIWDGAPRYMIRDRDRIYGAAVTRRLRAMGIDERSIGLIRRE